MWSILEEVFISSTIDNFNYLRNDYTGFHQTTSILNFLINLSISLFIIFIFLHFGAKVKKLFFKKETLFRTTPFIEIALGYITLGSIIALLGGVSLLYAPILISLIVLVISVSLYPFSEFKKENQKLLIFFKTLLKDIRKNKWLYTWILLFVLIGFLKLISPEMREDQYHTDLPIQYLKSHTTLLQSNEQIMVSASPQLGEMTYLIAIFLGSKEASRYIHFTFYILVLLVLYSISKNKNYKFSIIAPLIFATAPEVIHETSAQYTDFQWIFLFLLSTFLLTSNKIFKNKTIALSGLFFGAMIATKLWTIAFIIAFVLYIIIANYKTKIKALKLAIVFILASIIPVSVWFLRSFILTGNPVYPAFIKREILEHNINFEILNYFTLNPGFLNANVLKIFSPIFFLGLLLSMYRFKDSISKVKKLGIFLFFIILTILYIFINYPYGRYLLGLYSISVIIISVNLYNTICKFQFIKYFTTVILSIMFIYYLINSLLILPYGIGFADKNKYLTRTLSRDNSSYYDFDHKFNKFISKYDLVATYRIFGYYYADFNYIDINNIFTRSNKSLDLLKEKGVTKLFIKDGDMKWFCNKLEIHDCEFKNYTLLQSYIAVPNSSASYYLYEIK